MRVRVVEADIPALTGVVRLMSNNPSLGAMCAPSGDYAAPVLRKVCSEPAAELLLDVVCCDSLQLLSQHRDYV
jgi:hypothetical protein